MFERITATKWKLTADGRNFLGSILVYMRNEFRAGESAVSLAANGPQSNAIEGAATNYKRMQQCIDRILARLDGTWDAHKLTHAYGIIARALECSGDDRLSRRIINEAENAYGVLGADSIWNRIEGKRDAAMAGETRAIPHVSDDSE